MAENQVNADDVLVPVVDQLNYHDTPDLITDIKLEPPDCEGTKLEFVDALQVSPDTQTVPVLSSTDVSNDIKLEIKQEPQETIVSTEEIYIKTESPDGPKSSMIAETSVKPETENEATVEELNENMEAVYSSTIKCEDPMDVADERTISIGLGEGDYVKTSRLRACKKKDLKKGKSNDQIFSCPECHYQTFRKSNFNQHVRCHKRHEVDMFKCNECNYQTIFKKDLNRHVLIHQDPDRAKKYKCDQCDYKAIQKGSLKKHMRRHKRPEEVDMLRCNECNFQAFAEISILRHIQRLHMASYTGEIFQCVHCSYESIVKKDFDRHLLRHEDPRETLKFKCDQCNFKSIKESTLKRHMTRHESPGEVKIPKCKECDYQAMDYVSIKRHIQRVHMETYTGDMFKCTLCNYETIIRRDLNRHMLIHNDKDHKCDQCDFRTSFKANLSAHMLRHKKREEVDIFKCTECDYQSLFKYSLNRHMLVHKDKGQKCDQCDFETRLKPNLEKHMRHHKNREDVSVFQCSECNYQALQKANIKFHILNHHKNPKGLVSFTLLR